jgi:imidazolonepropionase-like amidohydrolase
LGCKTISHAVGRESILYSARAGIDIIFHAFQMDDECLDAVIESGATLLPSFTFLFNTLDFTKPSDPCHKWRPAAYEQNIETAIEGLIKARKAGVPFMVGTDSGFAVTPYGEWSARELQIMVDHLGFSAGEALKCTTSGNAGLLREGDQVGQLTKGAFADVLVVGADPLVDIGILQKRENIKQVYLGGKLVDLTPSPDFKPYRWEHSYRQWNDTYTRDRVAELKQTV